MGFYYNNKYDNTIDLSKENEYKNGIEIVNNEEIIFDATNIHQTHPENINLINLENSEDTIKKEDNLTPFELEQFSIPVEDCLYKIFIDYKDGYKDTLTRPILNNDNSWLKFSHTFNFPKGQVSDTIDIKLYNLYDFYTEIKIPFTIKNASIQEQGIELELLFANLDNNKNISYVFNEKTSNQVFLAQMKKS